MSTHDLAGQPAPKELFIDVSRIEAAFYAAAPDPTNPNQLVSFGTSGHRGTSSNGTFTETHILAITGAICEYRRNQSITGPLFLGSCRRRGIEPYAYLRDVLTRLPHLTNWQVKDITPAAWANAHRIPTQKAA